MPKAVEEATTLGYRQRLVRLLLYTGAVALMTGTFEVTTLFGWAARVVDTRLHFGTDPSVILETMVALSGLCHSLLLASVSLHAFVLLRAGAEKLDG